jgi:predicted phage terminase large subunit-like protein
LHPEREPLDTLDRIKRTIGEYNFAGQYQQSPAPSGGGLVKAEWFKRYRDNERPERFDRIVQSWDTANKATELSDFSVCTTWGLKGNNLFLIALFRQRLEYPALKRAVRDQQSRFGANVVLIEDRASGTQLIQELVAEGCYPVTSYKPTTDKIMRLHAQTAMIENGFVHIPEAAPWLAEYLHEMTVFPKGKHDDQVDSTAQFLEWVKHPTGDQAYFEYMRMRAERYQTPENPQRMRVERSQTPENPERMRVERCQPHQNPERLRVRLRAPFDVGSVQTFSGQHLAVTNRIVEMSAEDAKYFIRVDWTKLAEWTSDDAS